MAWLKENAAGVLIVLAIIAAAIAVTNGMRGIENRMDANAREIRGELRALAAEMRGVRERLAAHVGDREAHAAAE